MENQKQSTYKSVLGGILTLSTLAASLVYAVWVIYLWQTKQMNPKISNSKYVSDYSLLDLSQDVIKIYYWKYDDTQIDPFENNILLPLAIYTKKTALTEPELIENFTKTPYGNTYRYLLYLLALKLSFQQNQKIISFCYMYMFNFMKSHKLSKQNYSRFNKKQNNNIVPRMELGFSYVDGEIYTSEEMYIQIVLCSEIYLKPNQKCASNDLVEKFFKQSYNVIGVQIYSTTLNSRDGSQQQGLQEYYIQIEQQYCYTMNTFLETNRYEVQDYFLFGASRYSEFITGSLVQFNISKYIYYNRTIQTQTSSVEYCQRAFQNDALSIVYIGMKGSQTYTIFEYPRAGDLLANIGSIVSVLFMVKYLIIIVLNKTIQNLQKQNQNICKMMKQTAILFQINILQIKRYSLNFRYLSFIQYLYSKKLSIFIIDIFKLKQQFYNQIIPRVQEYMYNKKLEKQNSQNQLQSNRCRINEILSAIDINDYEKFYDKVSRQMQQKLSYLNLLYEISRLYFALRSQKYREELLKSHQVGIKINLAQARECEVLFGFKSSSSVKSLQDNLLLNEDDADLLSLTKRKTDHHENVPDEIYNEIDFYNTNKIQ